MSKIVYVDMDHVLCDYAQGFKAHKAKHPTLEFPQSVPGLYVNLAPIEGAIEGYSWLQQQPNLDVYILTAPSIRNPHCYSEKRLWVEKHLGLDAVRNLIISPHKNLNQGDYLIDDRPMGKGQENFSGKLIQFGSIEYPNWKVVKEYFDTKYSRNES